jgi:hypothetical protein
LGLKWVMKNKDEITAELQTLGAGIISGAGDRNVFHVPENYFGEFPLQMIGLIQHMNTETSFAIDMDRTGPFEVPANYFDELSGQILSKVNAMDNIVLHGRYEWTDQDRKNPFSIPQGYFENFGSGVLDQIFNQEEEAQLEIETISPLLAGLKKEKAFTVPENYFNGEVLSQKARRQEAQPKVVQHPAVKSITWARWAAAAAVLAIFTLGGFHYLIPSSGGDGDNPSFERALAQIPEAKIKDWLSMNMDESDINGLGSSLAGNIKTATTKHTLNNFSDKEVEDYLETEVW